MTFGEEVGLFSRARVQSYLGQTREEYQPGS